MTATNLAFLIGFFLGAAVVTLIGGFWDIKLRKDIKK